MRYYIVSWDCNGVEFLDDITKHHPDNWAKEHLFDSIKQSKKVKKPMSFNLQHLILRAQMNPQRHYEIYVFTSDETMTKDDILEWAERTPQSFADWVREHHSYKVYSDRKNSRDAIV